MELAGVVAVFARGTGVSWALWGVGVLGGVSGMVIVMVTMLTAV